VLGWDVPPTVFLSLFALVVIALAPLFAAVWRRLEDRGAPQSAPGKIAVGIAFLAASFLLLSVAAQDLAPEGSQGMSAAVLLSFYVLQAAAVAILGRVGLSMVTRWAPDCWVERLPGVWFFSTGLGGLLGGYAAGSPHRDDDPPSMVITVPVVLADRSEARNATIAAISSGSVGGKSASSDSSQRSGSPRSLSAHVRISVIIRSVRVSPGLIATTRMLSARLRPPRPRVNAISEALPAEPAMYPAEGRSPAAPITLTITPYRATPVLEPAAREVRLELALDVRRQFRALGRQLGLERRVLFAEQTVCLDEDVNQDLNEFEPDQRLSW